MENCETEFNKKEYKIPEVEYNVWSEQKLEVISKQIDDRLKMYQRPTVIVLEIGHFMLPQEEENLKWAHQNVSFANAICQNIIQKYKRKYKIMPTLLVNNLDGDEANTSQKIIDDMLKDKKYINPQSLKIISERNLKNRAFKALKNDSALADSFIHIDGKAYLKDDDYQHDLAAGFVNEDGDIIPRCGLILTSFLEMVVKLAKERLHQSENINILFISFSEQFHEYKRVMLGVDIYDKQHSDITIDPMIFHWSYLQDQCLNSFKSLETKTWESLEI